MATKFCMVVSDVCGSLVWNMLCVTFLVHRIQGVRDRFVESLCSLELWYPASYGSHCNFYWSIVKEDLVLIFMLMYQKYIVCLST
jgi:hypothetical protein